MKGGLRAILLVLVLCAAVPPQVPGSVEVARGFQVRPDGRLLIGPVAVELYHYDTAWVIAQQHDRFEVTSLSWSPGRTPTARAGRTRLITGVLRTARGPATVQERVQPLVGGIRYRARLASAAPLPTNELSVAFLLTTARFAGERIRVDGRPLLLPRAPAPRGSARLLWSEDAHSLEVPTPGGTLLVTGRFRLLVQDDREWGDARYSVRLYFTPGSGLIRESAVDLRMQLQREVRKAPAGGKTTG